MTIATETELAQTLAQVERLEHGLRALKRDLPNASPENLALLSEGPQDQLAELQAEIQDYRLRARGEDYLGVRLVGKHIHLGETPISVLTAVLDAIRKGVQAITELKVRGLRSSRPTAELMRLCDFRILALAPGSLRILMKLPDEDEGTGPNPASTALDDYLTVASWADSDDPPSTIEERMPDSKLRKAVLSEVQRVVPRPRGELELVEFSGPRVRTANHGGVVRLQRDSRARLHLAIDSLVQEVPQTHVGVLREIDLDDRTFTLRTPGQLEQKPCRFDEELLEVAREALDKWVEVAGVVRIDSTRRGPAVLQVTRLEILEPDGDSTERQDSSTSGLE